MRDIATKEHKMWLEQDHYSPWSWLCRKNYSSPPLIFIKYGRDEDVYNEIEELLVREGMDSTLIK